MGLGGIGSSESSTSQETLTVDNRSVADGNAVIWSPRNSGNPRNILRLGRGASYTVNNGIGGDALAALQSRIDILGRAVGLGSDEAAADKIRGSLTERTSGQIEDGPGESKKLGLVNWILIVAGAFVLVGASIWKFKKS